MRLKTAITLVLCTAYLPSPATASNFFEDLIEHTKEQANNLVTHTKEQIANKTNQTSEQVYDQADQATKQVYDQVDQTTKQVSSQIDQTGQSIDNAANFSGGMFSGGMDVIGLRLGMTPQKTKATLQTHNATMRIEEKYGQLFRMPNSRYLRHISATANTGEHILIEFSPPPHESVIVRLSRTTKYAAGARPTLTKTLQALEQKYGAPTLNNDNTMMHQLSWLYGKTGNKIASTATELVQRCTKTFMIPVDQLVISPQRGNETVGGCGESLNIQLTTDISAITGRQKGSGLVASLTATLDNAAELIRITQKTAAYIDKTIQTQAENVEAPKL